jgi:hypothetical protein
MISGSLSPRHGASSGCGYWKDLQYGGQLRIYLITSGGQPTRGGPQAWGLGEVLTNIQHKNDCFTNIHNFLGLGLILRWENNIKIDLQEVGRREEHELDRSGSD